MIPASARSLLDLHLNIARTTTSDTFSEESLSAASAMLGYAVAVDHLSPVEYSNELAILKLIREQRASERRQGEL